MKKLVVVGLSLLVSSWLSWSQVSLPSGSSDLSLLPDFDPSYTYQVPGVLLNKWKADSIAQQQVLKRSDELLGTALSAVTASQTSFETYKNSIQAELLADKVIILSLIGISVWILASK